MNNKTEIDYLNYDDLNLVEEKIKECTDRANEAMSPQINKVIDGKSTQETRSGKNLFKPIATAIKSGMTFTNNGDGSYSLNGTATGNTSFYVTGLNYKIGTYTLSLNNSVVISNGGFYVQMETSAGNIRMLFDVINAHRTATTKASINALSIVIPSGLTLNNFIFKPQLEKGSTATNYEPYGASPSPDYPSEIENVKGKNLINPNLPVGSETKDGITLTNNSDGTYTVKGTATKTTGIDLTTQNVIKLKGDTYYTNSIEILNGIMDGNITVSVKGKDGATIYNYINLTPSNYTNTIKAKEDLTIVRYNYYIAKGTTVDFTFRVQLEKGSTATRYAPYGNIQIVETGKNLLDNKKPNYIVGATWQPTETGGKISASATWSWVGWKLKLNMDKQYTFSYGAHNSKNIYLYIRTYTDATYTTIKTKIVTDGVKLQNTFKPDSEYVRIAFANNAVIEDIEIPNIQLEKGPIATDYESYTEEVVNIDLKGNELCSLPNGTKDELIVKDGRAKILKRIGGVVLDGSETISEIWRDAETTHIFKISDIKLDNLYTTLTNTDEVFAMCDYFKVHPYDAGTDSIWRIRKDNNNFKNALAIINTKGNANYKNIIVKHSGCVTSAEFKTWLSTHNTTVQYKLAEPYEIDLGPLEVYFTYKTKKWVINELPYIQEIDRIEKGIYNLGEKYNRPKGWLPTKEWITKDNLYPIKGFDYRDWNRWVNNLNLFTTDIVVKDTIWNSASFINWEQIGKDEWR